MELKRDVKLCDRICSSELIQAHKADEVISPIYEIVERKLELNRIDRKHLKRNSRILMKQLKKLAIVVGVLIRTTKTLKQIVLPEKFHTLIRNFMRNWLI